MGKATLVRVRFVEAVTVLNGSDVPPGPSYAVGQVVDFPEASAAYWVNRRCAVYAGNEPAKAPPPPAPPLAPPAPPRPPAPPPGSNATKPDLSSMTVRELQDYARSLGVAFAAAATKSDLIAGIAEAERASATKPAV